MTKHARETRKWQIHVPVNSTEYNRLDHNAATARLGMAAYLREVGLQRTPLTEIDQDRVEALQKINADLGRLGGLIKWWLSDDKFIKGGRVPVARLQMALDDIRVTQQKMRAAIATLTTKKTKKTKKTKP